MVGLRDMREDYRAVPALASHFYLAPTARQAETKTEILF